MSQTRRGQGRAESAQGAETREVAKVDQEQRSFTALRAMLEAPAMRDQIKNALPKHLTADRMIRVALTTVRRTPRLMECDAKTVVGAIVQLAQLGLEPDGILGHGYLVPRKNKNANYRWEASAQVGYKGFIALARRSGEVESISAHVVYSADVFEFEYGLTEKLRHVPSLESDRGERLLVYAIAKFKDGGHHFEVMSKREVEAIRQRSASSNEGPWVTDTDQMWRKTAIRRLANYLPLSTEFQRAAALDEQGDLGIDTAPAAEIEDGSTMRDATDARRADLRDKYRDQPTVEVEKVEGAEEGDGTQQPDHPDRGEPSSREVGEEG